MNGHDIIAGDFFRVFEFHHIRGGQIGDQSAEKQALRRHAHGGHGRHAAIGTFQKQERGIGLFGQDLSFPEVKEVSAIWAMPVHAQIVGFAVWK